MIIVGTGVTLNWIIRKTLNPGLSYFDLQITTPKGVVTYYEGSSNWASFTTPPNISTDGVLTRAAAYVPTEAGVYTLVIGTGGSANFREIHTSMFLATTLTTMLESKLTI